MIKNITMKNCASYSMMGIDEADSSDIDEESVN